ncbi:MAG: NAD(P)H-hydrate epimerase, partial [Prevotella sp.]|nr:NAD(P)H-hydrate epimerase [Prevotella sp.]
MKIFTSAQIRELDHYTIEHEPIKSIDLMERAAEALTKTITELWDTETPFIVFAGPGNNGGYALAVTRKLINKGYSAKAYLFNVKGTLSPDCNINKERLREMGNEALVEITREFEPPTLTRETVVIDGLFGSGINKPLGGGFAAMVNYINQSESKVVSIDIPSGLMTEDNSFNVQQNIIRADLTLTLGMKKLCMMMADNKKFIGKLEVLDIGLSKEFIDKTEAQCSILEEHTVRSMMKERSDYAHKGSMGHALLIAGSYGMAGAAILASKACLRSGAGKLTVHTPSKNNDIMQISVPEAIMQPDSNEENFSSLPDTNLYDAIGVGPGLGTSDSSAIALVSLIRSVRTSMVVDADALNILATHRTWIQQLPEGLIYTPHPKEFDKFYGSEAANDYDRLMK